MTKLPPYCERNRDRYGNERIYFRRDRFTKRIALPPADSADFMRAYAAAARHRDEPSRTAGSLHEAVQRYYRSPKFATLSPHTQKAWRYQLDKFCSETAPNNPIPRAERPLRALDKAYLALIIGRMPPYRQRAVVKVLRQVFDFAVIEGLIDVNPARDIKPVRPPRTDGHYSWNERDIAKFERRHPVGTMPRLAMAIMLYTGMRISDAAAFGPDHLMDGMIEFQPRKTARTSGIRLAFPAHPELVRIIKATPRSLHAPTYLWSRNRPFRPGSLSHAMRRWCNEAGLPDCSAHGLRKAIVRRLLEAGATEYQVAAITGHVKFDEIRTYARGLNNQSLGMTAIGLLPNPIPKLSQTRSGYRKKP